MPNLLVALMPYCLATTITLITLIAPDSDLLKRAGIVLTTRAGAERLGGKAVGLAPWASADLTSPDGRVVRVTGTPARHGPVDGDRGPVTGFVLALAESTKSAIYISGDTVWCEGVAEVGRRFSVGVAVLFMGAAHVPEVGPAHLTFTAHEAVEASACLQVPPLFLCITKGGRTSRSLARKLRLLSPLRDWDTACDGWNRAVRPLLPTRANDLRKDLGDRRGSHSFKLSGLRISISPYLRYDVVNWMHNVAQQPARWGRCVASAFSAAAWHLIFQ